MILKHMLFHQTKCLSVSIIRENETLQSQDDKVTLRRKTEEAISVYIENWEKYSLNNKAKNILINKLLKWNR